MPGPLDGVRIVDLTSVVAGPYASQNLGDMGADVIKVEGPDGDSTRTTGPGRSPGMAAVFLGSNRNKRSIVLDLKQNSARAALWQLIEGADVFFHAIRPQKLSKLGFGPDAVLARKPGIVYAAVHGYGNDGPYSGLPAYDDVIQGQSGVADLMNRLIGEPRYTPMIMADKTVANAATYAICAALFARERTGKGQFVEIPMFETMVAFNMVEHQYGHTYLPPQGDMGYPRVLAPWRRPYKTLDGHMCMLAYTDTQWKSFWTEVEAPQYLDDARFVSLSTRTQHIEALYETAGTYMAQRTTEEWVPLLKQLDIPSARVAKLNDLPDDPHLKAVGFFQQVSHPTEGELLLAGAPVNFSQTPSAISKLQPRLGEHSHEILQEAGLTDDQIKAMINTGATVQS